MYQVCGLLSPSIDADANLSAGWTIFDKLYILNGIVYIVSDDQKSLPDVSFILSKGIFIALGLEAEVTRLPTDKDIQVISTEEARQLFGTGASIIDGVTVCLSPPQPPASPNFYISMQLFVNDPSQLYARFELLSRSRT